jgi:tryptophan synthase alpha subunit
MELGAAPSEPAAQGTAVPAAVTDATAAAMT